MIPELNLFVICSDLNEQALSDTPQPFYIRNCQKNEYVIWKELHIDNDDEYEAYNQILEEYFYKVYKRNENLFFEKCKFICDENNRPVATCLIWKAYGEITSVHWLKVKKEFENKGLGRAILSSVLKDTPKSEFPILLHTHPTSYKAIRLYLDFGFNFITNEMVGYRKNDLMKSLLFLKEYLSDNIYKKINKVKLPGAYQKILNEYDYEEF